MTGIPGGAIAAAAAAIHAHPCVAAARQSDPDACWNIARTALEAAEETWPHDPPKRDDDGMT